MKLTSSSTSSIHPTIPASRTIPVSRIVRRQRTRALLAQAAATRSPAARDRVIDEVITLNIEVAKTIAARYVGRGIPLEDLEQVACMALVKAAQKFRPDQAEDFLAYAVPTIRGEVKRHFRDHGWTIRPPRRIQELQAEVLKSRAELEQLSGHEPGLREIAEAIGRTEEELAEAMATDGCFSPSSLDQPVGATDDTGGSLADLIATEEAGFEAAEARAMLSSALRTLQPRDRAIVTMRFFDGLTQQEIGDAIGVTQMHVSRLLSRILADLRCRLLDEQLQKAS